MLSSRLRGRLLPALALAVLGAGCAIQEAPQGGPADLTPPRLAGVVPDSGAVGLDSVSVLELLFSEKMEPQPAERFLFTYPPVAYRKTEWRGRRLARVVLAAPLPRDTVVVAELAPALKDHHGVALRDGRRWPLATTAELPAGILAGKLEKDGRPLAGGVVELFAVPPESLDYFRQERLRRAQCDSSGRYVLPWLPVPGGPWLLRAFADGNGDLRWAENEGSRLLPDTLRLSAGEPSLEIALLTIHDPRAPGFLTGTADAAAASRGPVWAWAQSIAESDTGWRPAPLAAAPPGLVRLQPGRIDTLDGVGPGLVRLICFADVDGDSLPSVLPAAADTLRDGAGARRLRLEPMAAIDSLLVEPGLCRAFPSPVFADTLPVWQPPPEWPGFPVGAGANAPPAAADTTGAAKEPESTPEEPQG